MSIVCKMTVLQSRAEVPRPKPKPASISNLQNKLQITYKLHNIFCQLLKTVIKWQKYQHENCSAHRRCL